ncbi:MAG: UvrD-helicase domain-containing protein [Oscillospiraceae bacterium]|nr:UvrD-helicase domain-containing protein [Oscillospiraceae bacterium]
MNTDYLLKKLNPAQREAVLHTEGALLIIAGAGSGKTSVLCHRIANIIGQGLCRPWQILAVTFTNKAAGELRERLTSMEIPGAADIKAGTFHSTCVRILRLGIEAVGYKQGFTIYDSDDSLRLIRTCMKDLGISEKLYAPKSVYGQICRAKDFLIAPDKFEITSDSGRKDINLETTQRVYAMYQKRMKAANALDFNDLIMKTVELFENNPDILGGWQAKFRYIMVDEYQDTNYAQYKLISLLAGKPGGSGNLCVVGDEDQSIYRFRGATIENILSFEEEFGARVIKLEQNYRSTNFILGAANEVISHNSQRKPKNLFTQISGGDKVQLRMVANESEEAAFISRTIEKGKGQGVSFGSNAVLYRMNSQSRTIESAFMRNSIPYKIIGGVKFYDRKEIKDILAYLCLLHNPYDFIRFRRIVNEPRRSIGDVSQAEIERLSGELGISPIDVMAAAHQFPELGRKAPALVQFAALYSEFVAEMNDESKSIADLIDVIIIKSGYRSLLLSQGEEGAERLQNIAELKSAAVKFALEYADDADAEAAEGAEDTGETRDSGLAAFLEQVALASDTDDYEHGDDRVKLMTIHSAKGLEFERVFLVGAEENLFPSYRSTLDPLDIEEERRLAYVAITRAKRELHITAAKERLIFGMTQRNKISRFVREIPEKYMQLTDRSKRTVAATPREFERKNTINSPFNNPKSPPVLAGAAKSDAPQIRYSVGEQIKHKVFGTGTIVTAQEVGGDCLLEIAFDTVGTKKIMANYAKVEKV